MEKVLGWSGDEPWGLLGVGSLWGWGHGPWKMTQAALNSISAMCSQQHR